MRITSLDSIAQDKVRTLVTVEVSDAMHSNLQNSLYLTEKDNVLIYVNTQVESILRASIGDLISRAIHGNVWYACLERFFCL